MVGKKDPPWAGCVGSRNYPLNVQDSDPAVPFDGVLDVVCPAELLPLTTNKTALADSIRDLVATGNTFIPGGLVWGWNSLSPQAPLTGGGTPDDVAKGLKKAIVLMTDGDNTIVPLYPYHGSGSTSISDGLTAELCLNAKAAGITIYTVAFQVTKTSTKDMLETCATSPEDYFDASNAALLTASFQAIGKSLTQLYLSK